MDEMEEAELKAEEFKVARKFLLRSMSLNCSYSRFTS